MLQGWLFMLFMLVGRVFVVELRPLFTPQVTYMSIESHGRMIFMGENGRIRRENFLTTTLSSRNATWSDLCDDRPTTNRLARP
jgi:hypothetical protein